MTYHGHRERLRKRLYDAPEKLMDYEILELLLGYVFLRRDTKPIAKELLQRFGSLKAVLYARPAELEGIANIGPGSQSFLRVLQEFVARIEESPLRLREVLASPQAVAAMARHRLGHLAHEETWIAYVDNQNRMIAWEKATKGTVDSTILYPRDILERALTHKATGIIVVHNHPGGNLSPSGADLAVTQKLQEAANALSIRLLDHVIVTETDCHSIMTDGLL